MAAVISGAVPAREDSQKDALFGFTRLDVWPVAFYSIGTWHRAEGMAKAKKNSASEEAAEHPVRGFAEEAAPGLTSNLAEVVSRALDGALKSNRTDFAILDELLRHGFSRDEIFELVVPRRTFARRRQASDLLSSEETDRAVRLARITALAERVFANGEKAHNWLREPSPMLSGSAPLALLKSETGAQLVEEALHRIDYGMFA